MALTSLGVKLFVGLHVSTPSPQPMHRYISEPTTLA